MERGRVHRAADGGKATAKVNALKHGLLSDAALVPGELTRDVAEWFTLDGNGANSEGDVLPKVGGADG